MNIIFHRKLPIPKEIKEMYPLSAEMTRCKADRDRGIRAVFEGKDDRFLLLIGPCSADRSDAVLSYLEKLRIAADRVRDRLILIPRIYTVKPRTSGDGYQGMFSQPDPTGRPDLLKGLICVRELYMTALRDYGFTCADELLYPENHRYLSDLLSYVAVGARSVENQQHRLTASGLSIPVGMKNPTGGDLSVMMNAIVSARHPHTFLYRGWEVESTGNDLSHAILRGYKSAAGEDVANYRYEDLCRVGEYFSSEGLRNCAVIVDTNHANSGKNFEAQCEIAEDVLSSRKKDSAVAALCKGLMVESYLVDGAQNAGGCTFGQSITDPCLGWEKTERLIYEIAEKV